MKFKIILTALVTFYATFTVTQIMTQNKTDTYWKNRMVKEELGMWKVDPNNGKVWFKTFTWEMVE